MPTNLNGLSDREVVALVGDWSLWARPEQLLPTSTDWDVALFLAGRGWGKTRTGAESVRQWVREGHRFINLVGRTAADVRDVMITGESGIMACCAYDAGNVPTYEPSKRQVSWPNGAIAKAFSADKPDQLRGPQCSAFWADEVASWRFLVQAWDNLRMGARLGDRVLGAVTTTPRPIALLKELLADSRTHVVRGATFDNARNLNPVVLRELRKKYQGTRIGRQELYAEILDDNPRALWQRPALDRDRVIKAPDLVKIVVAIDPAVSSGESSCETGIVVIGIDRAGHLYVLADLSVAKATPEAWARTALTAYHTFKANQIIAESNQGGEMVRSTLRVVDRNVKVSLVHASRGKQTRAEPISALSEQGKLHMVGSFATLEDQLCEWEPGQDSPDRLDAMVWGATWLIGNDSPSFRFFDRRLAGI